MKRLAFLCVALVAWQAVLGTAGAWAADDRSSSDLPGEMRGMIVLKFPFGGTETSSSPRLGFDFQMQQKKSEYDYLKERQDPETGRRLPEIDTGTMRTWQIDPPVVVGPEEKPAGRPEPAEPRDKGANLG